MTVLIWIKVARRSRDNHRGVSAAPLQVQDFLRKLPLFRELTAEAIDRLAAGTTQVRAPTGTVLYRRGEPSSAFYVVVYGQVKLAFSGSDGAEKVVEIFGPGQSFGELLMFLDEPHMVFAETLADSLLLAIGKAALLSEIDRTPRLARRMLSDLAQRLHRVIGDIEAYTLKSSAQRVIAYLLRDVAENAPPLEIRLPATKGVVASRLSITREHFSRVLHELTMAGLIKVSGRTICVVDPARLRAWNG